MIRWVNVLLIFVVFGRLGIGNSLIILSMIFFGYLFMNCVGVFECGLCFEGLRIEVKWVERWDVDWNCGFEGVMGVYLFILVEMYDLYIFNCFGW